MPSRTRSRRAVERGLSTHCRQQCIRPLLFDDTCHRAPVYRFDINRIGAIRIRHDGGGLELTRTTQALFRATLYTRLRTGIIELAGRPMMIGPAPIISMLSMSVLFRHAPLFPVFADLISSMK